MRKRTVRLSIICSMVLSAFMCLSAPAFSATFTVTSIEDSGPNTLRQAIADANPGDAINFSTGGNSITVYSSLTITIPLVINGGGTQVIGMDPNAAAQPLFFVMGAPAANVAFVNLAVVDSTGVGIQVNGANDLEVYGCAIGTDFSDSPGRGNASHGIAIDNALRSTIGDPGGPNVISGNGGSGVFLQDVSETSFSANRIGVASDGATPLPNSNSGILAGFRVWATRIGGSSVVGSGNIISGNSGDGITFSMPDSGGTTITGNIIGLTAAGATGPGNGGNGIELTGSHGNWIGQPMANYGNLIAGNGNAGIFLGASSDDNRIQNNIIGLDGSGDIDGNNFGIYILSGSNNLIGGNRGTGALQGNVVSGQNAYDIYLSNAALGNSVCGNFVGTSVDGSADRDAGAQGIHLYGSGNLIGGPNISAGTNYGNVISGHNSTGRNGVLLNQGMGNTVVGNIIGLNASGDTALPNAYGIQIATFAAQGNLIGGNTTALANIVSGNSSGGIRVSMTSDNTIIGNWVGLNAAGNGTIENTPNGIQMVQALNNKIGGTAAGEGNIICGSTSGINISANSINNTIVGNYIGVYPDLSIDADPPLNGIYASNNNDNFIGIRGTGQGNLIANCTQGIRLAADVVRMFMYGNTISANSVAPIQFLTSGTTANNDKPSPVITQANTSFISGTAEPNDFIELFLGENVAGPDGSLGFVNDVTADGSGNWIINSPAVSLGDWVVALATDLTNGTSEMSTNLQVSAPPTATPTVTVSATVTPTLTITDTPTITLTPTVSPTLTQTPIASSTSTATPTPSISPTSTVSPTITSSPTSTATPALGNVDLQGKTVMAYPNPGQGQINFLMHPEQAVQVEIRMYNLAGEQVAVIQDDLSAGRGQVMVWDCSGIAPGIYIAKVYFDSAEKQTLKIAVVK